MAAKKSIYLLFNSTIIKVAYATSLKSVTANARGYEILAVELKWQEAEALAAKLALEKGLVHQRAVDFAPMKSCK